MPKQFYILGLVLLLRFWPWQLFSGDLAADWLLSVIVMQSAFVMSCNILARESWATAIIIVETFCMILNIALVLIGATIFANHSAIMLAAFILELLIITISLQGVAVGFGCRLPLASSCVWRLRSNALRSHYRVETAQ